MSRMKAVTFLGNSVLLTSDGGASWEIAPVVPAPATLLNPFYLSSGDIVFTRWSYNGDQPRASILTLSADHCSTSVTLQSPANGASHLPLIIGQSTGPRQSLLFQWHGGGQILGREWRLQISSDTMFTSGSKVDTSMSYYPWISDYSVILPDFSISTTYYWKVVLKNIDGAISGGSETWHFSTAGGIISGRVYDDVNRNRQYDVGENPFSNSILQISGTMEGECRTDFAGIFFIKGIPSGSYNVKSVMSRPWRPS